MSILKSLTLVPLVLLLCACPRLKQSEPIQISCLVTAVSDGDTIKCTDTNKSTRIVRLSQIDAPEKKQSFGTEPTRVFRRQFILSHATLADSSNWR